ncbi:MAG: fumarylacetoacetate hydrolase family protein [Planctomycetaceae bacterium]
MRLCRIKHAGREEVAFYFEEGCLPLSVAAERTGGVISASRTLVDYLPGGTERTAVLQIQQRLESLGMGEWSDSLLPAGEATGGVRLRVPIESPGKILLLAGNYSKHIEEGGGKAEEREKTFPYVFMKPPATTLTHPGDPVRIPSVSPNEIDWELELGVVIGRRCFGVSEAEALEYVAGYTIVNDISDRAFHPNAQRNERPKDQFFDWLHGKWHDTFCPMGPCVLPADELSDPQQLRLTLTINGQVEQEGSTSQMVFPVAAVIAFISSFVTLQPGDIISTGTPHGVGKAKGRFLKPGDEMSGTIERIGTLHNPVAASE